MSGGLTADEFPEFDYVDEPAANGHVKVRGPSKLESILEKADAVESPHSVKAEEHTLGALLLDPAKWDLVDDITVDDFYVPKHRITFQTMLALRESGVVPAVHLIITRLEQHKGDLELAGGRDYLIQLHRDTATADTIRFYADIVADCSRKRKLRSMADQAHHAISDGKSSLEIIEALQPSWEEFTRSIAPKAETLCFRNFTSEQILGAIEPERYVLPGVPADAYALLAGALASYKSTLLMYLAIWKATGWDLLDLDPQGTGADVGKVALLTYEDTDGRSLAKLQRIIQHAHGWIVRNHGQRDAERFVDNCCAHIRRLPLAGQLGMGIVRKFEGGLILPNSEFLDRFFAQIRDFAPEGALICLDPLRLAIVGSQNDDDGADIVVHTLNRIATEIPGCGLIVASHTSKSGAKEGVADYADAAYATSGSALYSQHARSNFHMGRLPRAKIQELFGPDQVTPDEAEKQMVAKLTHGRLSHGSESEAAYLLMRGGILLPVRPQGAQDPKEAIRGVATAIIAAVDRLKESGLRVSNNALENDQALVQTLGAVRKIRTAIGLLTENGYLEAAGATSTRTLNVTPDGRALVSVESRRERPSQDRR